MSSHQNNTHESHVVGGLKAALHNPKVSEEAKQHAQQRLDELGEGANATNHTVTHQTEIHRESAATGKNEGNIIGGYKAALHSTLPPLSGRVHARSLHIA